MIATGADSDDRDPLVLKELLCEVCVLLSNTREGRDRIGPAKDLRLNPIASRSLFQQTIDQQFHQMNAESIRISRVIVAGSWQQKVVHTAYPGERIGETGRDARAEDRCKHRIGITQHFPFALDDVNAARIVWCVKEIHVCSPIDDRRI